MAQTLLSSTMSLARFAREHDLNRNQLARWRRELCRLGQWMGSNAALAVRTDGWTGEPRRDFDKETEHPTSAIRDGRFTPQTWSASARQSQTEPVYASSAGSPSLGH